MGAVANRVDSYNIGVVSSDSTRVTIKTALMRKGNGKPPHKIHFPMKIHPEAQLPHGLIFVSKWLIKGIVN